MNHSKIRKRKREDQSKDDTLKVKIPKKFIKHISSLGFNEEDAERLYEQKDDWMGINTGGKLFCAKPGCNFYTQISSDELFAHCRLKHQWKDYPCREDNCNYVAYSSTAFNHHTVKFHSMLATNNNEYPCSKKNCQASFKNKGKRQMHENIHDNVLIKCVFCPFTCVEPPKIGVHQRAHFNIRAYECTECDSSFFTQGQLNLHFTQKHSGETTECPVCDYESTSRNVYNHLKRLHKIVGFRWEKETNKFILPN